MVATAGKVTEPRDRKTRDAPPMPGVGTSATGALHSAAKDDGVTAECTDRLVRVLAIAVGAEIDDL